MYDCRGVHSHVGIVHRFLLSLPFVYIKTTNASNYHRIFSLKQNRESGFGLGIVLSIAVAILTWLALYILIISGKKINVYKYAILCEATMGSFGFYLLNSVIFFQSAGACITYMIVVGDTIPIILDILGFEISRRWVILVSSLLFVSLMIPLYCFFLWTDAIFREFLLVLALGVGSGLYKKQLVAYACACKYAQ